MEPAKTGRGGVPAAERVLRAASELFYREGIRAVGVDAIAAEAGVTKKTLYEKFGSKDDLVAAYLRDRDVRWREWLRGVVEGCSGPKERLLATFDGLEGWMEREGPRGCGFVNAYAEFADPNHPARGAVLEQKQWLREYLREFASRAGAGDPEDIARKLLMLHEGATIAYSLGMDPGAAQRSKQAALAMLADL